jgi:hypothetical protein
MKCRTGDESEPITVGYYLALRDVVTSLPIAALQRSVEALDNIVVRFQAFYGDVKEIIYQAPTKLFCIDPSHHLLRSLTAERQVV